jgi:hypothetical protein
MRKYLVNDALVMDVDITVHVNDGPVTPSSHSAIMHAILTEPAFQDVSFKFTSSSETLGCHRSVLALWSPVFKAMFQSDMSETRSGEILLEDVDPRTVEALLVRLYTGAYSRASEFSELVADILHLAHRYSITEVVDECEEQLISQLSAENVLSVLIAAEAHGSQYLKDQCVAYATANSTCVFGSVNFSKLLTEESK